MTAGGLAAEITAMLGGAVRPLSASEVRECLAAGRNIHASTVAVEAGLAELRSGGHVVVSHDHAGSVYRLRRGIPTKP
jgi:hypothetical protein